jgi:copper chaperone CopZ
MATKLTIMGMTCTHCARTVESALKEVEGVDEARVDYIRSQAEVQGRADIETLIRAVEGAGYRAAAKDRSRA